MSPVPNVFRFSLHPQGLAAFTLNFDEWASYLLAQLRRLVVSTGDHDVAALEAEVLAYPNVVDLSARADSSGDDEPQLLVPCRLLVGGAELSLFTTLTTFGTPRDITLDELAVELFFPADPITEAILRSSDGSGDASTV
jgi:hypothetical protein